MCVTLRDLFVYVIQVTMNLTFEQAAGGCDKDVLVNVADTCPRCLGNKAEPGTHKVQCHHCGGTGMVTDVLL